jgi:hypothetical protein
VTDGVHDRGTSAAPRTASHPPDGLMPGRSGPGWYPDPWVGGQHRYWTGDRWTADVFPDGPTHQGPDPAPWPPYVPETGAPAVVPQSTDAPARPRSGRTLAVVALVVGLIVGFVAVVAIVNAVTAKTRSPGSAAVGTSPTAPAATLPQETTPAAPSDPGQSALAGLVLGQSDVASPLSVQVLPGGDQVAGQPTLDLCNGTFPSEALRTARLQDAAIDAQGSATILSTEAVLYANPAGTAQAFAELKATAAGCPSTPVPSPVGEPTATTHFNQPPDGTWPQTPTVERLAFDFTTTDAAGQAQHSIGVYLRRGRVLMGVYFLQPDGPQGPVGGQNTIAGMVNLFAVRMAHLPASVVNGN